MERNILKVTYKDRKICKWVRENTKVKSIITEVKEMKWRWAGNVRSSYAHEYTADRFVARYSQRMVYPDRSHSCFQRSQ